MCFGLKNIASKFANISFFLALIEPLKPHYVHQARWVLLQVIQLQVDLKKLQLPRTVKTAQKLVIWEDQ